MQKLTDWIDDLPHKPLVAFSAVCLVLVHVVVFGCGAVKPIARTVDDVATVLCELYAQEQDQVTQGLSPREWCEVKRNVQPFIDEVLAAKQAAARKLANRDRE